MNILVIEDDTTQMNFITTLLKKCSPDVKSHFSNYIHCIFTRLPCYTFDMLILDFTYAGFELSDETNILNLLKQYAGEIIIYTSNTESYIRKKLPRDLNFQYVSKQTPTKLIEIINNTKEKVYA